MNAILITRKSEAVLKPTNQPTASLAKLVILQTSSGTGVGGLVWSEVSQNTTLSTNNGYKTTNNFNQLLLTLPPIANQGDKLAIYNRSNNGFKLQQQANQRIRAGNKQTALGIAGYIISPTYGDYIEMVYLDEWVCTNIIGNIDLV